MSQDRQQEQALFEQALDIEDVKERFQFLDQACARQPELRRRIEHLLELEKRSRESFDSSFSDLSSCDT